MPALELPPQAPVSAAALRARYAAVKLRLLGVPRPAEKIEPVVPRKYETPLPRLSRGAPARPPRRKSRIHYEPWSDEDTEMLTKLRAAGLSFAEIGRRIKRTEFACKNRSDGLNLPRRRVLKRAARDDEAIISVMDAACRVYGIWRSELLSDSGNNNPQNAMRRYVAIYVAVKQVPSNPHQVAHVINRCRSMAQKGYRKAVRLFEIDEQFRLRVEQVTAEFRRGDGI